MSIYLRWGVIIFTPLYLLNLYVETVYHYSLADYSQWLFSPSENSDFSFGALIITFSLFSLCTFWFNLFINGIYIKFFGRKSNYAYLGNSKKFNGHYYQISDPQKQTRQSTSSDIEYNYSFNNIERIQSFTSVDATQDELGSTTSQFSLGSLFTHLVIILFFLLPMLGTLHGCFAVMCAELFDGNYNDNIFKYAWEDSFELTLAQFQISLSQYYLAWVFLLFFMLFCINKFPRQQFGSRIIPLPKTIKVGALLTAVPVEMTTVIDRETYTEFGQTKIRYVDTSKRNITFKFSDIFKKAVYVTAMVELNNSQVLEDELDEKITNNTECTVIITDNLAIELIADS